MSPRVKQVLLLAVCIFGFAESVLASIVHYVNPPAGRPGHYDWHFEFGVESFLDITRSATNQSGAPNGNSVAQMGFPFASPFINVHGGSALVVFVRTPEFDFTSALKLGESMVDRPVAEGAVHAAGLRDVESQFPEGERRYIGVLTLRGNWGWIEVERHGLSLRACSWAYESEPGVALAAGQLVR